MFRDCTSLTAVTTTLPAEVLSDICYGSMFSGCTSLTGGLLELPAKNLTLLCYKNMFKGCTSLTQPPRIMAEGDGGPSWSMEAMFSGCTNMASLVCLIYDWNGGYSPVNNWMNGVAGSGVFYKNPAVADSTISGKIPSGWTIVPYAG